MKRVTKTINFSSFDGNLFSGRPRGESAREKAQLDILDTTDEPVECIFPKNMLTITSSFFLGMFEPSIKKFQNKEDFFNKYRFINSPDDITEQMDDWYDRALNKIKSGV